MSFSVSCDWQEFSLRESKSLKKSTLFQLFIQNNKEGAVPYCLKSSCILIIIIVCNMNRNRKVKKKVDFIFMHRGLLSFLQDNESGHFMPLFNRARQLHVPK